MRIMPNYPISRQASLKSFKAGGKTCSSAFENIKNTNIYSWDKTSVVLDNFDKLITAAKNKPFVTAPGFSKLLKLYKINGLGGLLYVLCKYNSEILKSVTDGKGLERFNDYSLSATPDGKQKLRLSNRGAWGFWNNILGLKAKNEISFDFDYDDYSLIFSLDKQDDYYVRSFKPGISRFVSFYADSNSVKKVWDLPSVTDLQLPPGLY